MGSISRYMADVAAKKGVTIALNSPVKSLSLSGNTVSNYKNINLKILTLKS